MIRKSFIQKPCTLKTNTAVVSQDTRVHRLQYVSLCAFVIKAPAITPTQHNVLKHFLCFFFKILKCFSFPPTNLDLMMNKQKLHGLKAEKKIHSDKRKQLHLHITCVFFSSRCSKASHFITEPLYGNIRGRPGDSYVSQRC